MSSREERKPAGICPGGFVVRVKFLEELLTHKLRGFKLTVLLILRMLPRSVFSPMAGLRSGF